LTKLTIFNQANNKKITVMKTYYFFEKNALKIFGLMALSAFVISCGSYQNSSYYDNDGVYGSSEKPVYQKREVVSTNGSQYENQFKEMKQAYGNETFTNVDNYTSVQDTVKKATENQQQQYADWGQNTANNTTIIYVNDNWGWNNWGMYNGLGWGWNGFYGNNWGWCGNNLGYNNGFYGNNWGWNGYYGNNFGWNNGWGWNNWGYNSWYGGFCSPYNNWGWGGYNNYYGNGYYGNGYYDNGYGRGVAVNNGSRGSSRGTNAYPTGRNSGTDNSNAYNNNNTGRYSTGRSSASNDGFVNPRSNNGYSPRNTNGGSQPVRTYTIDSGNTQPRSTQPRTTQPRYENNTQSQPRTYESQPRSYDSQPRSYDNGGGRSSGGSSGGGGGRSSGGGGSSRGGRGGF
jgi:uncharacterized membrane protein YgcG